MFKPFSLLAVVFPHHIRTDSPYFNIARRYEGNHEIRRFVGDWLEAGTWEIEGNYVADDLIENENGRSRPTVKLLGKLVGEYSATSLDQINPQAKVLVDKE